MKRFAMHEQMITTGRIDRHAMHAEKAAFSMHDTTLLTVVKQTGEEERGDAERETLAAFRKEITDQCRDSEYEAKNSRVEAKRTLLDKDDQRCRDETEQHRRDDIHAHCGRTGLLRGCHSNKARQDERKGVFRERGKKERSQQRIKHSAENASDRKPEVELRQLSRRRPIGGEL